MMSGKLSILLSWPIFRATRGLLLGGLLLLVASVPAPLSAENRYYVSNLERGELVTHFLDELESAKIKITIRKFFNEKSDGKLGFTFWLHPGKTHGEITFHDRGPQAGSFLRIYNQNDHDTRLFRDFFLKRLKLKEDRKLSGTQPPADSVGF